MVPNKNNPLLGTNCLLYKMNMTNNNLCTFCKSQEETITHLFWECHVVKEILRDIKLYYEDKDILIEIDSKTLILGTPEKAMDKYNIFWLEFKKYIFSCKRKQCIPNITNFIKFI